MTQSTSGRSSPRAATSVQSRTDGESGVLGCETKEQSDKVRFAGGMCPCNE